MKNKMKKFMLFALSLVPVVALAQDDEFVLKGKIGNIDAPAKVYLTFGQGHNQKVDSAILNKGKFEFKGKISEPWKVALTVSNRPQDVLSLYLEKGTINVIAVDSLSKANITGSITNAEYQDFKKKLKGIPEKLYELYLSNRGTAPEKGEQAAAQAMMDEMVAEQNKVSNEFLKENPNSFISLEAISILGGTFPKPAVVKPLLDALSPQVRNSYKGRTVAWAAKLIDYKDANFENYIPYRVNY